MTVLAEHVVISKGRGGARPGAGRKPKTEQNDAHTQYAKARAKHEAYKALLAELEYRRRAGELVERSVVAADAARLHAFIAQTLRSLPDALERKCALPPEVVEELTLAIDGMLVELKQKLESMADAG